MDTKKTLVVDDSPVPSEVHSSLGQWFSASDIVHVRDLETGVNRLNEIGFDMVFVVIDTLTDVVEISHYVSELGYVKKFTPVFFHYRDL